MKRRGRRLGVAVDPSRVREARLEAGLSLADLAGRDVSRTFLHFIEHGRSRPSEAVLTMIAKRTGKPISYFKLAEPSAGSVSATDLTAELNLVASRIATFAAAGRLTLPELEAMRLLEVVIRQGAVLAKAIQGRGKRAATRVKAS